MRPYEKTVTGLTVEGGSVACFAINYPTRCYLEQIIVTQTDGTPVGFDVDLLSRDGLCPGGGSDSDSDPDTEDGLPWELYKVTETLQGAAGQLYHQFDPAVLYINRDPTDHPTPIYRIYLRLAPEGTGDKTFAVTLRSTSAVE